MNINQAFTILQHAGGIRAARIITEKYKKISWIKTMYFSHLLRRGIPVAKIIHEKWFFGLKFYTNTHTLDPRPDTETLVSAVISDYNYEKFPPRILDLGTGTGCIICALCKNIYGASGVAVDKSRRALRVAQKNIHQMNITDKIKTIRATFDRPYNFGEQFDVVVSNPPYIAKNDTRVNDAAAHDPSIALYADENGLSAYKSIAKNAKHWLKDYGKLYLEIGIDQATDIKNIFMSNGWNLCRNEYDLGGIERVLIFEKVRP